MMRKQKDFVLILEQFAPITVEVKDVEKQIVFQSIIFLFGRGILFYLGDLSFKVNMICICTMRVLFKVVGNLNSLRIDI